MGAHSAITFATFPQQGAMYNKPVRVCFHYDSTKTVDGVCVRDDKEAPFEQLFKLSDGRLVRAVECQWQPLDGAEAPERAVELTRTDIEQFLVQYHEQVYEAGSEGSDYDLAGVELAKAFLDGHWPVEK